MYRSAHIEAPAATIAAQLRYALDAQRGVWPGIDDPHGPHGALNEIKLTALDDAEYARRRRDNDWRILPPTRTLVLVRVLDAGAHRIVEVEQAGDDVLAQTAAAWLVALVDRLWPAPASSGAGVDQVRTAGGGAGAGDDQVGLTEGEKEWYQTLLTCKTAFGNKEMTWSQIGDRHGVSGRTAKRRLQDLQARGLPGLDDWPDREN